MTTATLPADKRARQFSVGERVYWQPVSSFGRPDRTPPAPRDLGTVIRASRRRVVVLWDSDFEIDEAHSDGHIEAHGARIVRTGGRWARARVRRALERFREWVERGDDEAPVPRV